MKCIKKDALTKEDLEALTVEVKAMEMLRDHPNFVRYYDFFSEKYVRCRRSVRYRCVIASCASSSVAPREAQHGSDT